MIVESEETQGWILLVAKNRDVDQRLALIDKVINMSTQGARSSLTSTQEQKEDLDKELAMKYHYSGHQKFTN